jgi:hypothetical protein
VAGVAGWWLRGWKKVIARRAIPLGLSLHKNFSPKGWPSLLLCNGSAYQAGQLSTALTFFLNF